MLNFYSRLVNFFKNISEKKFLFFTLIVVAAALFIGGFYFWQKRLSELKPSYSQIYRLVNEKISQSAPIAIYLPEKIDKQWVQESIKFYPEIAGTWLSLDEEKSIAFQPKEKLKLNRYYLVELSLPQGGMIQADFLAVEDPVIAAIFPKENSEAPETSEITIVFNRPMVPLTTLGYLEEKEIPVEITPQTKGRFKWVTTSNLQFIPEDRLVRASNYKVQIKPGFISMDGLEVPSGEIEFVTRKLRYLSLTAGQIIYNQPISIYFNQPVDLEKTKKEITLINNTTNKEVPFIAEYKSKKAGSREARVEDSSGIGFTRLNNFLAQVFSSFGLELNFPGVLKGEDADTTVIQIYNREDKFGRDRFWDFENSYSLKINKAYPAEGDIILDESRIATANVTGPIKNMSAESSRTEYAGLDFFDPQGKLWIEFYEEIDLSKSKILASKKMKEIDYGEKCKEGETFSSNIECETILDKKKIFLTFQDEKINKGERLEINFEKIVNTEGLVINQGIIKKDIISFPEFQILRTFPENGSTQADLTGLILCSNSPIVSPSKEDYQNYFSSNLDYEIKSWGRSWRVYYRPQKCQVGEFYTSISYGLMPLADYSLELKLEDVFGQKQNLAMSFTTDKMPDIYLNFYHLQKTYNVSTPEKTKLTYATQNMEYVNLDICKLGAYNFFHYVENKPGYRDSLAAILDCQERIYKKIALPKKYWIKNYFKVDIKDYFEEPTGHYILTFYHPDYKKTYWEGQKYIQTPIYERTYLTITNLAVAEKRILPKYATYGTQEGLNQEQLKELSNLYWVTNLSNLEPVSGAKIELYQKSDNNIVLAGSYLTNEQGIAFTDLVYNLKGAIITSGKDSTILPSQESRLDWVESAFSSRRIYLYTDKPIYQPGQEVFIKGLYRIGYDGNYEIYQDKPVNLKIVNPKGDGIFNKDLEISDFGTFNAKIILDEQSPLGSYRICAKEYSCISFEVLEYVPASFEVKLKTDKQDYVSKDIVDLEVEANYYFGVPLEGGEVNYTISSQNYYFDRYSDGYFDFGSGWYYWPPYDYGDKFILRGKTSLDSNGKARISQLLDMEQLFKEREDRKSKIIVFDVTVQNQQGQSVSSQHSFILHAGEFYLGLNSDKSFLGKEERFNLRVKSADTQGKEIPVKNISLNLYKIDWIYSKRQEAGGGYSYKWEKKREIVKTYNFDTDNQGNHTRELQISEEGEYEAEVSAFDKRNNLITGTFNLYVYGKGAVRVRPTTNTDLEIEAEKTILNVGEKGKIIIKSPYSRAKALIAVERGKIFDYQIKEIEGNLYSFEFEVTEDYLPNIYVSVLLNSSSPEIKFGRVEFQINTERKNLDIEVKSNKKHYLPGEEVILDILTKDYQGQAVPAEVSLAVVDLSVLALKGNPKKNPLIFFYSGFPLTVSTASNIKDILVEVEIPTKGGGGMEAEALATKKRGVFRETAFWEAVVITDEQGRSQVKFTLPDNLTTWQAETLGITKDTKLGVNYIEFLTRKELMVVPLKPRFVVPGDEFYIGAQIFNQSRENQKLKVVFESGTLFLKNDKPEKNIEIKAGQEQTVYFKVESPTQFKGSEHRFLLSAKSETLQDSVEQFIAITPNNTYEVTATSNYTDSLVSTEYVFLPENVLKDRGDLTINSSATLAVFLSDALNYLLQFPYGCSEQIASRLNAIAVVKRGLNVPNIGEKLKLEKIKYQNKEYSMEEVIEIGLVRLYNNQNWDGGFAFWGGHSSNFYLTLHIVDTLNNLSLAGFDINQTSLSRAADYLYKKITTDYLLYQNKNNLILTAHTLFQLPAFNDEKVLRQKIIEIANDDLFLYEEVSNSSLAYLAMVLDKGFDEKLKKKVFDVLDNRIDIDGRGAFLETGKNVVWQYYETPIKNTALYLKAHSLIKSENPILDKIVRWLLKSRGKDGAWGSTNNTISVIDAFTHYLQWKKETESDFLLEVFIEGDEKGSFDFNPDTILEQFKKEVPIRELPFNKNNAIQFEKTPNNSLPNAYYYDISLKYYLPADQIPPRDEGFSIEREFYRIDDKKNETPLREAKVGEVLRGHIKIVVPKTRNFVMIEDYIPAGMEIVNLELATEQKSLLLEEEYSRDREYWRRHFDRTFYPDFKELHNDRVFLYKERLEPGVYEFDYYVRALVRGKFTHLPAHASEMYFPENFGRTDGRFFEVK